MTSSEKTIEQPDNSKVANELEAINNIAVPEANTSTINNADNIKKIEANIVEIKNSVAALKAEVETFDKGKSSLSKEVLTSKEKEIEDKRIEIENKKKETQELINKIRKDRIDLKLENLDETTKIGLETQKTKEEILLASYEADIKSIDVSKKSFREKIKDGAGKTWQWAKENPWKSVAVVTGVGLLVGWMAGWFKKKKKSENEGGKKEGGEEEGFWNHGIGRFLKYAGIGVGAFFGIKRLIKKFSKGDSENTGNDTEIAGTLRDTKNAVESFDAIETPATKEALNKVGANINDFYDYVYKFDDGTIPSELTSEKLGAGKDTYAGVIPHILDNTFETINDISSEQGLFTVGAYGDAVEISKTFAKILGKGLVSPTSRLINSTLGMIGCPKVIGEATEENMATKIQTFLAGANNLEEVHLLYRKIFKTMSYLNYAENAFLGQKIETLLKGGVPLYKKSGEDRETYEYDKDPESMKKLIKKISEDPDEFKIGEVIVESMTTNDFRSKKIRDIANMGLTTQTILQHSPNIQENIDDLNAKRKEKLDLLNKDPNEALDKMTALAEGEMSDTFFKSLTKIIPITHLFEMLGVGREDEVKKKIMEKGGFKELLDSYKQEFQKLKGQDKGKIKSTIDKYYAQLKELTVTSAGIYESQDENGNRVLHCIIPVKNIFTGYITGLPTGISMIVTGVGEIREGKVGSGAGHIVEGSILTTGSIGFWMLWFRRTKKLGLKLMIRPYEVPTRLILKAAKPYAKVGTAELVNPWILQKVIRMYKTPESIMKGLLTGMSSKSAFNLFRMQSKVTTGLDAKFLKEVLLLEHELPTQKMEFAMMEDLVKNKRFGILDRMITTEGWIIADTKRISMQASMDAMMPIYTKILKPGTPNVQAAGYKLLEKMPLKQRAKVEKLLSNPEIIEELNKIRNVKDVPDIVASLVKSLNKTADIDANINTYKNIIKSGIISKASTTTTQAVEDIIEDGVKNKAAYKMYEMRKNGNLLKEFESGGKYEKYSEFKTRYTQAITDAEFEIIDSDFAKRLIQDGKELDELLDFTDEQKSVYKLVQEDVKEIESKIAGLSRKTGNTSTTKLAHEIKIKNMINFERQLGSMTAEEVSAFKSLNKLEFKTFHIIELLKLKKANATIAGVLDEATPNFDKIIKALKQEKSAAGISDELIKSLEDIRMKPFMKSVESVAAFFKNILKFVGRVLKI